MKSTMDHGEEKLDGSLYLPDGSRYGVGRHSRIPQGKRNQEIVVGTFVPRETGTGAHVEAIRDPDDPNRLMLLKWENGHSSIVSSVELDGKILVPPSASSLLPLSLPAGLAPCDGPAELFADVTSTISRFVNVPAELLRILAAMVLATWFPEIFEAVPYLWVVGPLGSGKTKLLRLIWCLCRHGLLTGSLTAASIYRIVNIWKPTLIIDEFESGTSSAKSELLRILRTGSGPDGLVLRNGESFSTYGPKIIASRQPLEDSALMSRGVLIRMLPSVDPTPPLDEATRQKIARDFQAKLLMYRLSHFEAVTESYKRFDALNDVGPRTQQIARALTAPLMGDSRATSALVAILRRCDQHAKAERFLEPEWLVMEYLFETLHTPLDGNRSLSEILVGFVAKGVNSRLTFRGEGFQLTARKVGSILSELGLETERLGRLGRGLRFNSALDRRVHEVARQLGFDWTTVGTLPGLESGYGGLRCALCDEFGLSAGLRYVEPEKMPSPQPRPKPVPFWTGSFDTLDEQPQPTDRAIAIDK